MRIKQHRLIGSGTVSGKMLLNPVNAASSWHFGMLVVPRTSLHLEFTTLTLLLDLEISQLFKIQLAFVSSNILPETAPDPAY